LAGHPGACTGAALSAPPNGWQGRGYIGPADQPGNLPSDEGPGDAAGLATFSPHDLLRAGISNYLNAGTDSATVAGIVGHNSVQTTARYDRRGERAKQAAADNLHLAYTPRTKDSEAGR
jgi:hypothetical protein